MNSAPSSLAYPETKGVQLEETQNRLATSHPH